MRVVNVEGRTYPVTVRYRPLEGDDRRGRRTAPSTSAIVSSPVDEITREDPRGDVLIFLPGEREIRDAHLVLERRKYRGTEVLPLYARLSARTGPGVQPRPAAAHRAGHQRGGNLVDGAAHPLRGRPRLRARQALQSAASWTACTSSRSAQASANQRKGRCGRIAEASATVVFGSRFRARPEFTDRKSGARRWPG
jgi:ATP-dependent helicase HrpA